MRHLSEFASRNWLSLTKGIFGAGRIILDVKSLASVKETNLSAEIGEISRRHAIGHYYELTKPRIELLILCSTAVGYCYGVSTQFGFVRFFNVLCGTALMAGGSATLNQWYERDLDVLMSRTEKRPIPSGAIPAKHALIFGICLSLAGLLQLAVLVNALSAVLGLITLAGYLFAYTPLKTRNPICTTVGAFPGAMPPLIGFAAASGHLTAQAWVLFSILFLWQFPHFHAIAWLYREQYERAGIKMLAVVKPTGFPLTREIMLTLLLLVPATLAPVFLHMAGTPYLVVACVLNGAFLYFGFQMARHRTNAWAKKLLLASVLYLPALFVVLIVNNPKLLF